MLIVPPPLDVPKGQTWEAGSEDHTDERYAETELVLEVFQE